MNVCGLYKFDWTLSLWAKCWTRAVFRAPVNVLSLLQWKMNNYKPSTQLFRHQGSDCLLNLSFNSTGPRVCRGEKRTAWKEGCLSSVNGVCVCDRCLGTLHRAPWMRSFQTYCSSLRKCPGWWWLRSDGEHLINQQVLQLSISCLLSYF